MFAMYQKISTEPLKEANVDKNPHNINPKRYITTLL